MSPQATLLPELATRSKNGTGDRSHRGVIRVALAGCGVVGGSLLQLLEERGRQLEARHGLRFQITRVLVRNLERPRATRIDADLLTTEPAEFLAAEADIVVEAMGGLEPAGEIVRTALRQGKGVITANKALLAAHGAELANLARRSGAPFEFEAAVGGGVPVIRTLRDSLAETGVKSITGILNGTSNFILTRLAQGIPYATALADAQRAGFAEADPTRDLDGTDVADKIRILAWLAFGTDPAQLEVDQQGILPDPDHLARSAAVQGGAVKLLAECTLKDGRVTASVRPTIVAADSEWASTHDEINLIAIETRWNGTIKLSGPGAGGPPTASAVLGDLVRAANASLVKA